MNLKKLQISTERIHIWNIMTNYIVFKPSNLNLKRIAISVITIVMSATLKHKHKNNADDDGYLV